MAKRPAANKPKPRAGKFPRAVKAKGKSKGKHVGKVKSYTRKAPVQQPLIEGIRYDKLDRLMATMADIREQRNSLDGQEKDVKGQTLKEMQKRDVHSYTAAGINCTRVAGDEKLSVHVTKSTGNAVDDSVKSTPRGADLDAGDSDVDGDSNVDGADLD